MTQGRAEPQGSGPSDGFATRVRPPALRDARSSRRLKTISLVIRSTQGAEEVLRAHEEQLKEAQAVPATLPELEATKAALKVRLPGLRLGERGQGHRGPEEGPWG